jgi:hypothetical protein
VSRLLSLTTDEETKQPPSNLRRQLRRASNCQFAAHDNSASIVTRQAETAPA